MSKNLFVYPKTNFMPFQNLIAQRKSEKISFGTGKLLPPLQGRWHDEGVTEGLKANFSKFSRKLLSQLR